MTAAGGDRPRRAQQAAPSAELSAGRVGRAHGLDGSFYVTRPRPRLLGEGTALSVGALDTRIVRRAGTDSRPIVRVEGVDSREAADGLRGAELTVQSAEAPSLEAGEFWAHELEGCVVYAGERRLGVVERLIELPSCEALEVVGVDAAGAGGTLLVPMVKDAVLGVAPGERRIEVDLEFLGLGDEPGPDEPEKGR